MTPSDWFAVLTLLSVAFVVACGFLIHRDQLEVPAPTKVEPYKMWWRCLPCGHGTPLAEICWRAATAVSPKARFVCPQCGVLGTESNTVPASGRRRADGTIEWAQPTEPPKPSPAKPQPEWN